MCLARSMGGNEETEWEPRVMLPCEGASWPSMSLTRVDLPAALGPMRAQMRLVRREREMSARTGLAVCGYVKCTSLTLRMVSEEGAGWADDVEADSVMCISGVSV